jgi:outer membrane lipoprotein SlyB
MSGAGQAYRITLRMDDGSTQVVSQATTPSYRSGDRVNLSGSTISR